VQVARDGFSKSLLVSLRVALHDPRVDAEVLTRKKPISPVEDFAAIRPHGFALSVVSDVGHELVEGLTIHQRESLRKSVKK